LIPKIDVQLVILSGPSGVGKDAVIDAWKARNPRVMRIVSMTTRAPRKGETEGVDYFFVTRKVFEKMVHDGGFLEYKEVFEHYYGTPWSGLTEAEANHSIGILKIDVKGAMDVIALKIPLISIFILPLSEAELEKRLRGRGTDAEDEIELRLSRARREIEMSKVYQYRVVNDNIQDCVSEIEQIVNGK